VARISVRNDSVPPHHSSDIPHNRFCDKERGGRPMHSIKAHSSLPESFGAGPHFAHHSVLDPILASLQRPDEVV